MIGLFFGETQFPKLILKKIKKTKKKYLILDLSDKNIFKRDSKAFRANIGQFGSILKLLREKKIRTKFDYILFSHVIEHLKNPIFVLKKLRTILKKNGTLLIETPNFDSR